LRIDLHVHTSQRSACGKSGEDEMITAAVEAGLDAIALTDHNRLPPAGHLEKLNGIYSPFRIFSGIEINVAQEHIVVIGLEDPLLETREWEYADLWKFVKDAGGYLFLAHPFRNTEEVCIDIDTFPPDGVEINSCNMGTVDPARVESLAARHGLRPLCNSDAHRAPYVGIFHNVLTEGAASSAELVKNLQNGELSCARLEERIDELKTSGEKILR